MMTALLLYSYSGGIRSSRKIESACEERVDVMAVTGRQTPDHRTINDFRKRHLEALKGLFKQVLDLSARAGLVKLGHVALDGTKVKANASKHKAMSYGGGGRLRAGLQLPGRGRCREPRDRGPTGVPQRGRPDPAQADQAKELSADAGYCTEDNLKELSRRHIRGYVATGRRKHEDAVAQGLPRGAGPRAVAMRTRLRRGGHRSRYRLRKQTAEPVIGNLKDRNGLRQFFLRGLAKVTGEWSLACTAHNLLKLAAARA